MPFTVFPFETKFEDKSLTGTCTIIDISGETEFPYKFKLYRVALNTHLAKPEIYLFYEVNKKNRRFYWYRHPELRKREKYELISMELEKLAAA